MHNFFANITIVNNNIFEKSDGSLLSYLFYFYLVIIILTKFSNLTINN